MKGFKINLQLCANSITTVTKYLPILDEIYKTSVKTSIFDARPEMVRETAQAKSKLDSSSLYMAEINNI